MNKKPRILLSTNVAYWPSVGGTESVLARILEGSLVSFDRVVVFVPKIPEAFTHNGIEVRPFSIFKIIAFAIKNRPAVFFPNVAHNRYTVLSLCTVSWWCKRTVVNMVGGYTGGSLLKRWLVLKVVEWWCDAAIHVDALSTEYLIDNAFNNRIAFSFIPQGIDKEGLDNAQKTIQSTVDTERYFVYAHNLWSWKRPELFIHDIVQKMPSIKFKIIASNTTGDRINEIIKQAQGIQNLEVLLGLPRADFLKVFAGSSGIISTSQVEGAQPNILLEAGYLGIPYFSLCPGQNFSHYPHVEMFSNTDSMRSRLNELKDNVFTEKSQALKQARRFFMNEIWNWDHVVRKINELFGI